MSEKKNLFKTNEMTRRQFLKVSGMSLAGFALTGTMLDLFGCTQEQVNASEVTTWAMPQGLLVVNEAKCTGCQRCELNCTLNNDGVAATYFSRVKIARNLHIHGEDGLLNQNFRYFPDTCRQCADPACGNICPQKAITTDDRGIRMVDQTKCIGCGACVNACPWHMPTVNPETKKSSKCIACGKCAEGCPSGALSIIPWDEVTSAAQEMV